MASVNKCIFIGNLGKDVELRYDPSGNAVANWTIACNESFKDKDGVRHEKTEWVNIVCFGKQGENASKYLQKGSSVFVEGRLQTRKWTTKEGQDRYTTEIVADRVQYLDKKSDSDYQAAKTHHEPALESVSIANIEDDIPF